MSWSMPGALFRKIVIVAVACFAAFVPGRAAPVAADEPADWVLDNCVNSNGSVTTNIVSGVRCNLRNRKTGTCLVRKSSDDQTDWNFAPCESRPRDLTVTTKDGGSVACGRTVAVKLGNEYFRKCRDPQKTGINICSEAARVPQPIHYDWRLDGCSGPLQSGTAVALVNVSRKDSIVYARRPNEAVDTCWSDTVKYGQCTSARDK